MPETAPRKRPEHIPPASPGTESRPARQFLTRRQAAGAGTGAALLAVLCAALYGCGWQYTGRILPRTTVAGVPLGGLTPADARARLEERERAFTARPLPFRYGDRAWTAAPSDFGASFDLGAAADRAYSRGRTGSPAHRALDAWEAPFRPISLAVDAFPLGDAAASSAAALGIGAIETPARETGLDFAPGNVSIVPGAAGSRISYARLAASLADAFSGTADHAEIALEEFRPEVTPAQADAARTRALSLLSGTWRVTASGHVLDIPPDELATWLSTEVARDGAGNPARLRVAVKPESVEAKVAAWAEGISTRPANARVELAGGTLAVGRGDEPGLSLDTAATVAAVRAALSSDSPPADRTVAAAASAVPAEVRGDTLGALGITELIGTDTTDFSGSPANRAFNIALGARSLDGTLVNDGDTFSTMGVLGTIDTQHGYRDELVIKGNRTIPEAGGGLCQVSTTLFRSVLSAGLPVTERRNHAYRVGYYERGVGPGLDATIYDPAPDFKWKNDTGHAVLVQASVRGSKVTFDLFGTKDGRVSSVSVPQVLETYPAGDPIYADSSSLPKGQTKQVETAHDGAKVSVTYTVSRNGAEVNRQVFDSTYRPWPAQYLVGAG